MLPRQWRPRADSVALCQRLLDSRAPADNRSKGDGPLTAADLAGDLSRLRRHHAADRSRAALLQPSAILL
jgi:hypothetical protein